MAESSALIEIDNTRTISTWYGIFLLINGAVGAGILNIPYGFMRIGNIFYALLIEALVATLIFISYFMMLVVISKNNHTSYMEMVGVHLGTGYRIVTELVITLYTLVACTAYSVIMGNQFTLGSILFIKDTTQWYADRRFLMVVTTLVALLPFLFPKNLNILSKASVLGGISICYIIASVAIKYFLVSRKPNFVPPQQTSHFNILSYLNLIIALTFGFQNHLGCVSILSQFKVAKLKIYLTAVGVALAIVALMYGVIGVTGMLTFGIDTKTDVLLNYDPKDIAMSIGRYMLMIVLIVSNSLTAYVGRLSLHHLIFTIHSSYRKYNNEEETQEFSIDTLPKYQWHLSAIFWYTTCITIGIFVPNIGTLIPFIGGFAAYIILLCPATIYILHESIGTLTTREYFKRWSISLLMIIIGSFIFGIASVLPFSDKFTP